MSSIHKRLIKGENGFSVLLADVPNAGTTQPSLATRSGNPNHDTHSGKFGSGGGPKKKQNPANVDPHEYQRMLAAARDAAREFDSPDEGDIREFLQGRARNPEQVDIEGFLQLVRQQRLNDMADLLDQQFRATGPMRQGRRKVRLSAPRGFMRKALKDLQPSEVQQLVDTIVSRGHDEVDVKKFFDNKGFDTATFSDEYDYDPDSVVEFVERVQQDSMAAFSHAIENMPAPVVHVTVPPPEPRKRIIKPERDPETGLIVSITEDV